MYTISGNGNYLVTKTCTIKRWSQNALQIHCIAVADFLQTVFFLIKQTICNIVMNSFFFTAGKYFYPAAKERDSEQIERALTFILFKQEIKSSCT